MAANFLGLSMTPTQDSVGRQGSGDSPEETLPCGEVGALEECVLQDALHTPEGLDHVRAVVVEVPQLAVVALMCPPEGVLLQHLVTTHTVQSYESTQPHHRSRRTCYY